MSFSCLGRHIRPGRRNPRRKSATFSAIRNEMTSSKDLRLKLSARERLLLSEYGYPFEDFRKQLSTSSSSRATKTLNIDPFYLDKLIGNLAISMKEVDSYALIEELDALCEYLEDEERRQRNQHGA